MSKKVSATIEQYTDLQDAYSYLNKHLFDNKLPDCLITLHRLQKAMGHDRHEKFRSRSSKDKVSEIGLNTDTFENETDIEILSTLLHEMVHLWQYYFGTPSRKGYHNWEWANKMKEVGLQPSSTGEHGGKETGQKMSDYIIEGGRFEIVAGAFLLKGSKFHWNSFAPSKEEKKKNKTREKFTCTLCLQSAQAKKTAKLICGVCEIPMIIENKEDDE